MDAMRMFAEADERWLGRFGESCWKRVFECSGVQYIPLCDIENGRAPAMVGAGKRIILPDFDVSAEEWRAYIDSKAKKQSVMYRARREVRHGIDRRNYEQYLKMGLTQKKQVGLGVIELFDHDGFTWSGSLLVESFLNLSTPCDGFSNQAHMVYWPRKRFLDLDSLAPDELLDLANGRLTVNFEHALRGIFGERKQQKSLNLS